MVWPAHLIDTGLRLWNDTHAHDIVLMLCLELKLMLKGTIQSERLWNFGWKPHLRKFSETFLLQILTFLDIIDK